VLISLTNSGGSFSVSADQPLLDAARDAGLNLPHSCKGGNCGACKARLLRGEIHYPNGKPLGLSDAETAEGMILLCQARARSDLTLETFQIRAAGIAGPKRLPCRIERAVPLSHDVMGLFLRLPVAEDFTFAPGQYIDILLPGGRRRSFSIVSPPHDARPLELHVRHVAGGEFGPAVPPRHAEFAADDRRSTGGIRLPPALRSGTADAAHRRRHGHRADLEHSAARDRNRD
jgi:CDP-4-dehydro-6-deoxyglucose reductase